MTPIGTTPDVGGAASVFGIDAAPPVRPVPDEPLAEMPVDSG